MPNQAIWEKAAALLEDRELFNAERERVLAEWPRLNSGGMGAGGWKKSKDELEAARSKLQESGGYEPGIFNTLEFFVTHEAYKKSPGSTRRRGYRKETRSSYGWKHVVESYMRRWDKEHSASDSEDRYTANGAFILAALMAGVEMSNPQSYNPTFVIGYKHKKNGYA